MTNLSDLIDKSKRSRYIRFILDQAVKNAFGNKKPLTEILNKLKKRKA